MRWLLAVGVLFVAVLVFWRLADAVIERTLPDAASQEATDPSAAEFAVRVRDGSGSPAAGIRLVLGLSAAADHGRTTVVASAVSEADGSARLRVPGHRWRRIEKSRAPLHLIARFPALSPPQVAFSPVEVLRSGEAVELRLPPAGTLLCRLLDAQGELPAAEYRVYAGWKPADPEVGVWRQTPEIFVQAADGEASLRCGPGLAFDLWVARADGSGRKPLGPALGPEASGETRTVSFALPQWKGPRTAGEEESAAAAEAASSAEVGG